MDQDKSEGPVRIQIKRDVLMWSIAESQKTEVEIAQRFPKIVDWLDGSSRPTFRQLERLAAYLHVPFGYLFLDKAPVSDLVEKEFRSFKNKLPMMSKNLRDTIKSMARKQDWLSDYREKNGWSKLSWLDDYQNKKTGQIIQDAILVKSLLDLTDNWSRTINDYKEAYNLVKSKLEEKGLVIMSNAVVGLNNNRKLDVNEFRAFMLFDSLAPLIFINSNDSWPGKVFSLIHEFVHVLIEQDEIIIGKELPVSNQGEQKINRLTAEILMPKEHILTSWQDDIDTLSQINQMALNLKVSDTTLAIRLYELGKINKSRLENIVATGKEHYARRANTGKQKGGNFYNTFRARLSPSFLESVIRSTEAGETNYTDAFRLLDGVKGKTYTLIKEQVIPYG